jgi:hypothetical protein
VEEKGYRPLRAAAELFPPVYEREYQGGGRWEEYEVENPTRRALLARAAELELES